MRKARQVAVQVLVRLVWAVAPTQHPVRRAFRLAGLTPATV
jgi:hypothetical protein